MDPVCMLSHTTETPTALTDEEKIEVTLFDLHFLEAIWDCALCVLMMWTRYQPGVFEYYVITL